MNITFEFTHVTYGVYKDALCLPDNHEFTELEIQNMKQQRFDNWVAYLEAPPVEQPIVEETVVEEPVAGE